MKNQNTHNNNGINVTSECGIKVCETKKEKKCVYEKSEDRSPCHVIRFIHVGHPKNWYYDSHRKYLLVRVKSQLSLF